MGEEKPLIRRPVNCLVPKVNKDLLIALLSRKTVAICGAIFLDGIGKQALILNFGLSHDITDVSS